MSVGELGCCHTNKKREKRQITIPPPPTSCCEINSGTCSPADHDACSLPAFLLVSSGFCSSVSECFSGASLCMKLYEFVNIVFPLCQCTSLCTAVSICLLLCTSSVCLCLVVCLCLWHVCVCLDVCVYIFEECAYSDLEQDNSPC